jgi:hypothetical protein
MIVVTHEIAALRPVLTRVVAMRAGRIVRDEAIRAGEPTGAGEAIGAAEAIRVDDAPAAGIELDVGHDPHHDAPVPLAEVSRLGEQQSPLLDPIPGRPGMEI